MQNATCSLKYASNGHRAFTKTQITLTKKRSLPLYLTNVLTVSFFCFVFGNVPFLSQVGAVNFSVSVSMNGGLERVGNANMVVYARAPNVTGVKFSNNGARILVDYDSAAEIFNGDKCSDAFSSETLAQLGESPGCRHVTRTKLEIIPGRGANISVGDSLVFKDEAIKARGEPFSRFLNGSFPVNSPDNPIKPVPIIRGGLVEAQRICVSLIRTINRRPHLTTLVRKQLCRTL